SLLGLTSFTVFLAILFVVIGPGFLLRSAFYRSLAVQDLRTVRQKVRDTLLHPTHISLPAVLFSISAAILWIVFDHAVYETADVLYTGVINNFGDLPFHLSVITSFAYGNNFPPEDPTYAGVRFTYPFLTDFVSAIFVHCGATLRESMFIENIVVAVSFVGLI